MSIDRIATLPITRYLTKSHNSHPTLVRWNQASQKHRLIHRVKDVAIYALQSIGFALIVLSGAVPLIQQHRIEHRLSPTKCPIYTFFGLTSVGISLVLIGEVLKNRFCSWTNYHNRNKAVEVVRDFQEKTLNELATKYQNKIPELIRWGILPKTLGSDENQIDVQEEVAKYFQIVLLEKEIQELRTKPGNELAQLDLAAKENEYLTRIRNWTTFKTKFMLYLPQFPEVFPGLA